MTYTNQSQTKEHAQLITGLAIDTIDAYTMAHDIVSELSAIFDAQEKLVLAGISDERVLRSLNRAGFRQALERLEMIDAKITDANETLAELQKG